MSGKFHVAILVIARSRETQAIQDFQCRSIGRVDNGVKMYQVRHERLLQGVFHYLRADALTFSRRLDNAVYITDMLLIQFNRNYSDCLAAIQSYPTVSV